MVFDYDYIFRSICQTPLLIILCSSVVFVKVLIELIKTKFQRSHPHFAFNIVACLIFVLVILEIGGNMKHGIFLLKEGPSDAIECSGYIDSIYPTHLNDKFYLEELGRRVYGSYVVVDGKKLYFACSEELKVGDYVEVRYLPKSTVVLQYEILENNQG